MTKQVEIMRLLLEATRRRRLRWSKVGSSSYEAMAKEQRLLIVFKYPLLAGDDGSDADIAEVHVPGLTLTYYNGTEGFDLALQVLAEGIPSRRRHLKSFDRRTSEAAAFLKRLIDEAPEQGETGSA